MEGAIWFCGKPSQMKTSWTHLNPSLGTTTFAFLKTAKLNKPTFSSSLVSFIYTHIMHTYIDSGRANVKPNWPLSIYNLIKFMG